MPARRGLFPLLKREYWGLRANTLLLLVVFILPVSMGLMFGTLKNISPKSAPAGIFPEPGANEEDVRAADGVVSFFARTSPEPAFDEKKLYREEYYFFVGVPPGFRNGVSEIKVYVDSSMSPVAELSPYVKDMILYGLSKWYSWAPNIDIIRVGKDAMPFQYLIPGIVIMLTAAIGLITVPFSLSQDRDVLSRVLLNVQVPSFVAGKLLFASILSLAQFLILLVTQHLAGAPGAFMIINFLSVSTLVLSCLFFTSLGVSVMFLTRFGEAGKQINAVLLGSAVLFSGAFYPVGFFPSVPGFGDILQTIGKSNPAYFFVVLMRGFGIRGLGPEVFYDYLAIASAFTLLAILVFTYLVYRRKKNG